MARGAIEASEMVWRYFRTGHGLMALVAGYCSMASREREARLLVLGERVSGGLESGPRVALLAAIPPRRTRELPLMFIGVTIEALCEFDFELRVVASRHVARCAFHVRMGKDQRETCLCVVGD